MPTPPLIYINAISAIRLACDGFGCSEAEAIDWLEDARLAGRLDLRFTSEEPRDKFDRSQINWYVSEVVVRTWLQISTIPIGGYNPYEAARRESEGLPPREYRYPSRIETTRYPFRYDRRQLEPLIDEAADTQALTAESADNNPPQRRGAYVPELALFMAQKDLKQLVRAGPAPVAVEFIEFCREHKPTLQLPQQRHIEAQVEKILDRRTQRSQSGGAEAPKKHRATTHNGK